MNALHIELNFPTMGDKRVGQAGGGGRDDRAASHTSEFLHGVLLLIERHAGLQGLLPAEMMVAPMTSAEHNQFPRGRW